MGFKGIVGHEDIIAHFKSSIETGNVAHAYIISGDAGSGKKALAYAFAETLECEAGGTEACGTLLTGFNRKLSGYHHGNA